MERPAGNAHALCCAALLYALLPAGLATAAAVTPASSPAPAPASTPATPSAPGGAVPAELYLEVSLNGAATGSVARFVRTPAGGFRTTVEDLRELGLDAQRLGLPDAGEVDLDAIAGLAYTYDAAGQRIALRLADALRTPVQLQARSNRAAGAGSASPGLLLNYDLYAQSATGGRVSVLNELRYFDARGAFSTSGVATLHGAGRRYIRHETSWSRADPVALTSLQVGDFVSRSLSWSRSLRLGGVEWRKNFDLRPDLVTYPVADIAGSAVVPSSVSLYVNGMQQFASDVPDGPFVLNGVTGLNGAGQATVVTRDALGREVASSVPLYIDTRLLAPGFSDYAFAFGLPRRDFGLRSFSYAATPVASASLRHGVSDTMTLESHVDASAGQANLGGGAMLRAGQLGVLHGALAGSAGRGDGAQASIGYQYLASRFSVDAQSTRASRGYADLGTREGSPVSRVNDRLTLNLALPGSGALSASYIGYRLPDRAATRLAALAWSMRLGSAAFLSVNAYQDLQDKKTRGMMATLSLGLPGRVGASTGAGRRNGSRDWNSSLSRAADVGGGVGWSVQDASQGGARYTQANLHYLGSAGQLNARVQHTGGRVTHAVGAAGALVAMDGAVLGARQVGRAFALVSTGLPGVPVLQENRPIGRTDAGGRLLVADLVPYMRNGLSIDTAELPLDVHVRATSIDVVPQRLAGVVAAFAIERYTAATVVVVDGAGRPLAPGTRVALDGGATTLVGHDGVVFVEDVREENRLVIGAGAAQCEVRFRHRPAGAALARIGPLTCVATKGEN